MDNCVMTLPNEQELVARALCDPTAFADVYDHYVSRVYTYFRYRVSDSSTAEDLTAQTFEQALVHLSRYQVEKGSFGGWLFGIAYHLINHHYRRQRRWEWLSLEQLLDQDNDTFPIEDVVIHKETLNALLNAVSQLRESERNLVALKFGAGLTNRQIAEICQLSESNVGVMLYRSIKQLRGLLHG